jgi:hypothetical protein
MGGEAKHAGKEKREEEGYRSHRGAAPCQSAGMLGDGIHRRHRSRGGSRSRVKKLISVQPAHAAI